MLRREDHAVAVTGQAVAIAGTLGKGDIIKKYLKSVMNPEPAVNVAASVDKIGRDAKHAAKQVDRASGYFRKKMKVG